MTTRKRKNSSGVQITIMEDLESSFAFETWKPEVGKTGRNLSMKIFGFALLLAGVTAIYLVTVCHDIHKNHGIKSATHQFHGVPVSNS